jgi:hypothetical protein
MNAYIMAEKTKIGVYDDRDFKEQQSWEV